MFDPDRNRFYVEDEPDFEPAASFEWTSRPPTDMKLLAAVVSITFVISFVLAWLILK